MKERIRMKINLTDKAKVFTEKELELSHKNFIFGRNGSGKSTLCDLILLQKHYTKVTFDEDGKLNVLENSDGGVLEAEQDEKYDVKIFQGFESVIGEDKNLNAIALSGENKSVAEKIKREEKLLQELYKEQENLEKILKIATDNYNVQNKKLDDWYKLSSKTIKEHTQYQVEPNYNKRKFENDITQRVRQDNLEELTAIINEKAKNPVEVYQINIINMKDLLLKTNDLLKKTVEISGKCEELNSQEKEQFAQQGMRFHKEGEKCLFCEGLVTKERLDKLNQHFNEEYQKLEKEISNFQLEKVSLKELNQQDFYATFSVTNLNNEMFSKEKEINNFIETLQKNIDIKKSDITKSLDNLCINIPEINNLQQIINNKILENNQFGANLSDNINKAKEDIKFHLVYEQCEAFNYDVEKNKLDNFRSQIPDLTEVNQKINLKNIEIKELKNQQRDTTKIATLINERLIQSGKADLQLVKIEKDGLERYEIHNGENLTRPISQISTGEKNIIAFLYFIFSLENIERTNSKPKIIIFDDPMNSNDDTMQYLIITELHKLYQGKDREKYNPEKDYFICLTHNVHFYLNVQPAGNYPDKNGKTKYDKNNFFRIENKGFKQIKNEKEDFKTNYAGLWIELAELCQSDFKYSILNSMRRIIETFVKFNNLSPQKFYQGNEQYLKLFNVNSHSIDDLSQEQFAGTTAELKAVFLKLFEDNEYKDHYDKYWKE